MYRPISGGSWLISLTKHPMPCESQLVTSDTGLTAAAAHILGQTVAAILDLVTSMPEVQFALSAHRLQLVCTPLCIPQLLGSNSGLLQTTSCIHMLQGQRPGDRCDTFALLPCGLSCGSVYRSCAVRCNSGAECPCSQKELFSMLFICMALLHCLLASQARSSITIALLE